MCDSVTLVSFNALLSSPLDFLGLFHHWILVHRVTGEGHTVPSLGVSRTTYHLLDDGFL